MRNPLGNIKIRKFFAFKESVRKSYEVDIFHLRIGSELWVDVKEYRKFYCLSGIKTLFFKAETLNFVEILASFKRNYVVGRNSVDR